MSICDLSRANHAPHPLANRVFKILGYVCKRFLPSSPPLPSLIFCSRPIFRAAKTSKSCSSDCFCSETPRKRLLRRLYEPPEVLWKYNGLLLRTNTRVHPNLGELCNSDPGLLKLLRISRKFREISFSCILKTMKSNSTTSCHFVILWQLCYPHPLQSFSQHMGWTWSKISEINNWVKDIFFATSLWPPEILWIFMLSTKKSTLSRAIFRNTTTFLV